MLGDASLGAAHLLDRVPLVLVGARLAVLGLLLGGVGQREAERVGRRQRRLPGGLRVVRGGLFGLDGIERRLLDGLRRVRRALGGGKGVGGRGSLPQLLARLRERPLSLGF